MKQRYCSFNKIKSAEADQLEKIQAGLKEVVLKKIRESKYDEAFLKIRFTTIAFDFSILLVDNNEAETKKIINYLEETFKEILVTKIKVEYRENSTKVNFVIVPIIEGKFSPEKFLKGPDGGVLHKHARIIKESL